MIQEIVTVKELRQEKKSENQWDLIFDCLVVANDGEKVLKKDA